jgi:hypothetical protein
MLLHSRVTKKVMPPHSGVTKKVMPLHSENTVNSTLKKLYFLLDFQYFSLMLRFET